MSVKYTEFVKRPGEEIAYTADMILELKKCSEDIWNFLPYIKIVHPDRGIITFEPYDFQKKILKNLQEHRHNIILCSRQSGKTTTVSIYAIWYAIFHSDKTIGIVSNKQVSAIDIMNRIKRTYEELPVWMKPGVSEYSKTFVTFDNGTKIMVSATSEDAFRGRTLNCLISDELAFVRKNIADAFWAANYPTISASKDAKIVLISTPNGMFNQFHVLYSQAERNENQFHPFKSTWRDVPGRDTAWAENQKRNLGKQKWTQEFECVDKNTLVRVFDPSTNTSYAKTIKDLYMMLDMDNFKFPYKINSKYKILTPTGFQDFEGINCIEKNKIVEIETESSFLRCSETHRIKTDTGFRTARDIEIGDFVFANNKNEKVIIKNNKNEKVFLYDLVNVENGNEYYTNDIVSHNCEFLGSTNTVIAPDVMEYLFTQYKPPIRIEMGEKFRIFEKPIKGQKYVLGCLPPEEIVITNKGNKNIADVASDDMLYDENGNETKIKCIQRYKDFEGEVYDIGLYGSVRSTKFTGEHPILVSKQDKKMKRMKNHSLYGHKRYGDFDFKYVKAEDIVVGDWICYPNTYKTKTLSDDILDKKWNEYTGATRMDFQITKNPLIDKDFWWFVGMWLGDGWIQNRNNSYSVHTCHDINGERHLAKKVKDIIEKYNRCVNIHEKNETNTISTSFNSKQIHHFLQETFGQYSNGKYISEWVKYIPIEYKHELIRGYIDSDGCVSFRNDVCCISITSVSLDLAEGIQDILYSLGYISSVSLLRKKRKSIICGRACDVKETYQIRLFNYDSVNLLTELNYTDFDISKISISRNRNKRYCYFNDDKTKIYIKIKSIEKTKYKGDVYNFETESHTFLCRNLTTHNCDSAKGTGENSSVVQVLKFTGMNPLSFEQVAVFQDNFTDVYTFTDIINRISIYYNGGYIMVENNAEGAAVVNKLWWEIENEHLVNTGAKAVNLGIRATKSTKPKAVLLMKKLIEDGCLKIYDKETVEQLASFIEKNGKFFGKDLDDDLVSALYWAVYVSQMDIFDETIGLKVDDKKSKEEEEEIWGVLADVDNTGTEEDWSWVTDVQLRD